MKICQGRQQNLYLRPPELSHRPIKLSPLPPECLWTGIYIVYLRLSSVNNVTGTRAITLFGTHPRTLSNVKGRNNCNSFPSLSTAPFHLCFLPSATFLFRRNTQTNIYTHIHTIRPFFFFVLTCVLVVYRPSKKKKKQSTQQTMLSTCHTF